MDTQNIDRKRQGNYLNHSDFIQEKVLAVIKTSPREWPFNEWRKLPIETVNVLFEYYGCLVRYDELCDRVCALSAD